MSTRRRRALRVLRALLVVVLAAAAASAIDAPHARTAAAESPDLRIIGKFVPTTVNPAFVPTADVPYVDRVSLYPDTVDRVLYTVDFAITPGFVAAYDLDSLKPIGRGVPLSGVATAVAVAPDGHGLVVAAGPDTTQPTSSIVVLDVRGGKLQTVANFPVGPGDLRLGVTVVGITGVPGSSTLYVESATSDAGSQYHPGSVTIAQLEPPKAAGGVGRIVWAQPVADCRVPVRGNAIISSAIGYVAASRSLFFGCAAPGNLGVYQAVGVAQSGAGRVALSGAGALPSFGHFELYPIASVLEGGGAFSAFDSGSGRLLVVSNNPTLGGATAYVFDGTRQAWVGGIGVGTNQPNTIGIDGLHGRTYILSPLQSVGLVAADVRPTPVSQGTAYPEWSTVPDWNPKNGRNQPPSTPIATDPTTRRVFLGPYASPPGVPPHHYVYVVRDEAPYYRAPVPDDPDANTADLPEREGVTGSTFATSAQGYGAVYRMVGGWRNAMRNVAVLETDQYPVGPGTRELDVALVDKLSLTPGVSSARVITADRDADNTGEDMSKAQASWPFDPAQCSDFGDKAAVVTGTDSSASCNAAKQKTTATVDGGSSSLTGSAGSPVVVHDSNVVATLERDSSRGAVATVRSTVHGITLLGGAVRIGQIVATATAAAHGRPGTAKATYTRTISHVTLNGTTLCTSPCSTDAVAAAVNSAFPGRLRLDFPTPETSSMRGSRGGYLAAILRDPVEQTQEVFLNEQAADRTQVPALIVTMYADNTLPSRMVAYLAGTQVESRYGIFPLDRTTSPGGTQSGGGTSPSASTAAGGPKGDLSLPTALAGRAAGSSAPQLASPYGGVAGALRHGLHLAVSGLRGLGRLLPIWLVLLAPVYLSARRRLLLTREAAVSGGSR